MAGNWIKVEHVTPDKPEVRKLARLLNVTPDDAFGKVVRFWMWADENCVDGVVDGIVSTDVDDIVRQEGFSKSLEAVGWLRCDDKNERVEIPNHGHHNGETAKSRASKNKRQAKWRKNVDVDVDSDASTKASTREEKRREDNKGGKFIPPTVQEVSEYCKERKNGIDPQSFIDHYESNGWYRGKTKIKDWKACVRTWEKNSGDKTNEVHYL